MAWRLVKKPDGLYNIFSTVVDDFVYTDCTKDEVFDIFEKKAVEEARRDVEERFENLENGFRVLTYEDALAHIHRCHRQGEDDYEE